MVKELQDYQDLEEVLDSLVRLDLREVQGHLDSLVALEMWDSLVSLDLLEQQVDQVQRALRVK